MYLNKKAILYTVFVMVLILMYATDIGLPGIAKYWDDFQLLDMQLFYSEELLQRTMVEIGREGIRHYLYYFGVDAAFIIVLFLVQLQMSQTVNRMNTLWKLVVNSLAMGRAVFDIIEDLLLILMMRGELELHMTPFASTATALKFACLFIWGIGMVVLTRKKNRRNIQTFNDAT